MSPLRVPARFKVGIARYRSTDDDDLAEFQLRTFGPGSREVDPDRSVWLFDQNPWRGDGRDLWVCRRDGAIVGQQAEIPFGLRVGEHDHRAIWGIDLMVDQEWRMRGVGPALVATQLDEHGIVGWLNMSELGLALYTRAGVADLGVVPVYVRPLDLRRAGHLGQVPPRLRRIVPLAAPALRAVDGLASGGLRLAGGRLEPIDRFDDRVDEVWRAALPDYPVIAHRDLEALAWRIDQRPDRDHMERYYLVRRGRTLGYVVMRTGRTSAEPTAVVVDYLAPARWVAPLLVAAGAAARRQGAVAMSVKTRNEPADRYLRAAGFLRRDRGLDSPIRFMLQCADDDVSALVTDAGAWFITAADCDLEHATAPADETAGRATTTSRHP
jgi:GNAT superfamily N-acetyltransferase